MTQTAAKPSTAEVVAVYAKAGNTTFGGGDPTVAALRRELCDQRGWLTQEEFAVAFSIGRVVPGTNVLAFVAASAYLIRGWVASLLSTLVSSAPSAFVAVWLLIALDFSKRNMIAKAATAGILASVVGMMVASAWQLVQPSLTRAKWPRVVAFTGGALLLREWAHWSPVQVLFAAAIFGAIWRDDDAL